MRQCAARIIYDFVTKETRQHKYRPESSRQGFRNRARSSRDRGSLQFPLRFENTVLVNIAAAKKAVMDHAQGKQINSDYQNNKKQESHNSKPRRPLRFRRFFIRIRCHETHPGTKSCDCHGTTAPGSLEIQAPKLNFSTAVEDRPGRVPQRWHGIGPTRCGASQCLLRPG